MIDEQLIIDTLLPHARQAGEAIMEVYEQGARVETKSDGSPVTRADKAAEKILLDAITMHFPDIAVVSEENPESHAQEAKNRFFIIDPLDGTREFLRHDGLGSFTVNIGLIEHGVPVLGIIYAPALKRMFYGSRNLGAFEGKQAIKVRRADKASTIAVASLSHRDPKTDLWLRENGINQTRAIGSSLKFCLLACGEADIYPRFSPTMEWDTAAGDAILRAAGGSVTNPDGSEFRYGKPGYKNGDFIARSHKP